MSETALDRCLTEVGEFGPFQLRLQLLFSFMKLPQQMQVLLTYFAALSPSWICTDNEGRCSLNSTYQANNDSRCSLPRNAWAYSKSQSYSIVTEFNLICDDEWLVNLSTSVTFIGWAIGSVALGHIADNYGRRNVLFGSYLLMLSTSLLSALSPSMSVFIIARFVIGIVMAGVLLTLMVMASEFVGQSYRPITNIQLMVMNAVGNILLCICAYFVQNWKILLVVCTAPYYLALVFWLWVPESIRWLQSKNEIDDVKTILKKVSRVNKKETVNNLDFQLIEDDSSKQKRNILALFGSRTILLQSLVQGYGWFAVVLVYYGLSLASSDLGVGSLYLNFILISLVEIPGSLVAIVACKRFGRKVAVIYPLLIGGSCCLLVAFLPTSGLYGKFRLACGLLGKLMVNSSFDAFYTWSMELYPTHLRGIGTGFLQVTGRIGGGAAPWIAKGLIVLGQSAPFIGMGAVTLTSGILLFYLPETKMKQIESFPERKEAGEASSSLDMNSPA